MTFFHDFFQSPKKKDLKKKKRINKRQFFSVWLSIVTLKATPHKVAAIWPPTIHHEKLSKLDKPYMQDTAGEAGTSS